MNLHTDLANAIAARLGPVQIRIAARPWDRTHCVSVGPIHCSIIHADSVDWRFAEWDEFLDGLELRYRQTLQYLEWCAILGECERLPH